MKSDSKETLNAYADRFATRCAIFAAAIILVVIIAANWDRNPVPMLHDPKAWGTLYLQLIQPIVFLSSFVAFIYGVKKWNSLVPENRTRSWYLPVLPFSIAMGLLATVVSEFGMRLVEQAFKDLYLAMFQGAFIMAVSAAIVTYVIIKNVITIHTSKMLAMLLLLVGIGIYITMVEISDPYWWRVSLSYLGTVDSSAREIFNYSVMLGGILIISWVPMFLNDFRVLERGEQLKKHSYTLCRYSFLILGVAVFNVGMFPSRESDFDSFMHNISAYSLAVVLAVLMSTSKWIVPKFPKEFFVMSYILLGLLLTTLFLAGVGYFNTVGLELIGFVLGFMWLGQFISNVEATAKELEPEGFPA